MDYLERFPAFLQTLGDDAVALGELVSESALPESARQTLAGGLNYLFKSLDLIPDGIDDIGLLDDAFVLRMVSEQALAEGATDLSPDQLRVLNRMAEDMDLVGSFLGSDLPRMETYVKGLRTGSARRRSAEDIVHNATVQGEFLSDLRGFAQSYRPPRFTREEKTLVKLRAFFDAKLPRQA